MDSGKYGTDYAIAALATPLGESALAVIRCSGVGSVETLAKLTDRQAELAASRGYSLHYCALRRPDGALLDRVMVAVYRAPKSYTGEDSAEIFCHGSIPGIRAILSTLYANGFREARGGEFTVRAFLNGKMDLSRAEAVGEIIKARTFAAQQLAVGRLEGSVERHIDLLKQRLVRLMAAVSIQLDYPDDEVGEIQIDRSEVAAVRQGIAELAASYKAGRLYQEGVVVALAGRTNAGKSSLFNALLREDRSIVSDIHGTTRDYIEASAVLGDIPARLYDTAGLRAIDEAIESEGIRRTRQVIERADVILYLVDGTAGLAPEDETEIEALSGRSWLGVWTKSDAAGLKTPPADWVQVSSVEHRGTAALIDALLARFRPILEGRRDASAPVIASDRQFRCLEEAGEALDAFLRGLGAKAPLDAAALDLGVAISRLGEITGEVTSEDILDQMFGNFCVGK